MRLALLATLLTGCASTAPGPAPSAGESATPAGPSGSTAAGEQIPPLPAATPKTDSAMLALLNQSERAAASGDIENAMAYTERAVRIEPERADLWTRLATLQLDNGDPVAAIQYASKALTLAKHRADWLRDAWLVIADAREALGETDRAREIRERWQTYRG